jgi:anti-sigma regulatory factor (Ser/Thr protein kinase)
VAAGSQEGPRCRSREPRIAPDSCPSAADGARDAGGLDVTLDRDAGAPARARTAIRGWSEHKLLEPCRREALELLVSETVTNAVQHASAPEGALINLVASSAQEEILVRVTDGGLGPRPRMRRPSRGLGGYGLHIVERESRRWGVEQAAGTTVWFAI